MENFINQHKAALSGNLENQSNNKCDAINCFSTNKDFVNFVSCDTCDRTYHPKCECIADAYSISAEQVYCCLRCSEVEDIARLLNQKISNLLDEEDLLMKKTILSTILCDNLNAKYNRIIGLREKMLNAALDGIKVVRQAHHGNVMVGNHCNIVLQKYHCLTKIIKNYRRQN